MLDISAVIPTVKKKLKSLPTGHGLDLRTYKRDRSVRIIKLDEESLRVSQDGFEQNEFTIPAAELGKTLKSLLKKEFPRSNKVRLYTIEED